MRKSPSLVMSGVIPLIVSMSVDDMDDLKPHFGSNVNNRSYSSCDLTVMLYMLGSYNGM